MSQLPPAPATAMATEPLAGGGVSVFESGVTPDTRRRRIVALLLAAVVYAGLGTLIATSPEAVHAPMGPPTHEEVQTFSRRVELPKPRTPPEPPPPKPPPEVPPPPVAAVEPRPVEARPTEAAPDRPPRPERPDRPDTKPTPPTRKTVVLKSTALSNEGRVRVHGGASDVYGDPSERATEDSTKPDDGPRGTGPRDAKGTAPSGGPTIEAKPAPQPGAELVPARVKRQVKGVYPADAPRIGRAVNVTLSLRVDEEGRVVSARVIGKPKAVGDAFDVEAQRVARLLEFTAATRGGTAVAVTIPYTVVFEP